MDDFYQAIQPFLELCVKYAAYSPLLLLLVMAVWWSTLMSSSRKRMGLDDESRSRSAADPYGIARQAAKERRSR